ncbi:MAG: L,D-transpeptidase/peptidoglycan binding protein [Atopobiaceae bacterium]|jgi:lipoprotein-anchoring transpeptidase ErfK/SrfK|nr:L,D-transpeptidase/peptidoglycan binding protein [Atopobiaceae bacterium]MCI2173300.1 L,D-transpeptidase/peptidoglycan binding protein [Atopobiaceae bacterium]MCI2207295.1 L,D-transpeptidase/peptidoglycan binding protein [Atopobiaceae bacterium]
MPKKIKGQHTKEAVERRASERGLEDQGAVGFDSSVGRIASIPTVDGTPGTGEGPSKRPHRALKVMGIVAAVLAGAYVAVAVFFMFFFMPNTKVDGSDVSMRLASSVASDLDDTTSSYKGSFTGDGLDLTVKASDVDLKLDTQSYVSQAIGQINSWAWPYELTRSHDIEVPLGATYDADKLASLVSSSVEQINATATQPANATVGYDEATQRFAVVAEVYGSQIDQTKLLDTMGSALESLETNVTLGDECLASPDVTKDDASLATAADNANKYLDVTLQLTLAGSNAVTVDASKIKDWVTLDENLQATLDASKVTDWAKGDLSDQLDTVGTTRTYTHPDDGTTTTVSGGTYGWTIDGASLAETIVADVEAGKSETIEIPTSQEAATLPSTAGAQDWGASYVDIDLTNQYVRFYDASGTVTWSSSCVSGKTSDGHGTPTGVYSITSNMDSGNVKLVGDTDPSTGQPEYTSYVSYWMPFIGNAYALHDASWRYSFGGTIYQYNGSHGCVNLPSDAAKTLYGLVSVGTVVVVHD